MKDDAALDSTTTDDSADWPDVVLSAEEQSALELLSLGLLAPLRTFMTSSQLRGLGDGAALPDGSLMPGPVVLADRGHPVGTTVALRDPEGDLLGALLIDDVFTDEVGDTRYVTGRLTDVTPPVHYDLTGHRIGPGLLDDVEGPFVLTDRPLDLAQMRQIAGPFVAVVADRGGDPGRVSTPTLVKSLSAAGASSVIVIPRPPGESVAQWRDVLARNLGRDLTAPAAAEGPGHIAGADLADALRRRRLPETDGDGADLWDAAVMRILAQEFPPPGEVGFTVFFTGFSGSGKSTVAGALAARLVEVSARKLTLLDGDLVRTHLSSELGFSREHRDLNVTRIGFVAAEVTRHGGIAVCAPIAPYEDTREVVAGMVQAVGRFVLVHVSTPIEVCEERDRKGLYAKARAGIIKEFTGISDPYDVPPSPDVVIDTSVGTVADAATAVFDYLVDQCFFDLP